MAGKECFVPSCTNNSTDRSDLLFVPILERLREEWCRKVKAFYFPCYLQYCCEDHLDRDDIKNYHKCKLMNQPPKMSRDAQLRRFLLAGPKESVQRDPLLQDAGTSSNTTASNLPFQASVQSDRPDDGRGTPQAGVELDEEMVEVKIEPDDESTMLSDPLSQINADVQGTVDNAHTHESTEPVVKEEIDSQEDSLLKQELERYKALYIKMKDETTAMETENQRLTSENLKLSTKLQGFTTRIEEVLQMHEKQKKNETATAKEIENDMIKNLSVDKHILLQQNKELGKNIQAVIKQNHIQMKEIRNLTKANGILQDKVKELSNSNKNLMIGMESLKGMNSRKDEELNVFVQKIKTLNEDVERLKTENERLQREIQVTDQQTADKVVEDCKGKRKQDMSRNQRTDTKVKKETVKRKR